MYARLQSTTGPLPPTDDPVGARQQVVSTISGHPGYSGVYLMEQIGVRRYTMLTLWQTRENAEQATERTRQQLGPRPFVLDVDEIYEVDDDWAGSAAGQTPTAGVIVHLPAPLSEAQLVAGRYGARQRIRPALDDVAGLVRMLALWDAATRKIVIVNLATSVESLESGSEAINSTDLLPGEDPALLTSPERIDAYRVVDSSAAVVAAAP